MTIEEVLSVEEMQIFDRKSVNIEPKALAIPIIAFANADGGTAAILLFGKNPQLYFPRARVRFIRYEGTEEYVGAQMNVIKDVIFEGNILNMITDAIAYLDTQIKEKTYLGNDGLFVTEEEYPKFVRQEIIVNAITHRDYSIRGTDIQIKMFDDRIVVESPGRLPGLVKAENIRYTHFSRNPKIAEFLKAYSFVKEYGEGVDRMCKELEAVGLQDPEYRLNAFILQATVRNKTSLNKIPLSEEKNHGLPDEKPLFKEKNHGLPDEKPLFKEKIHGLMDEETDIEAKTLLIRALEEAVKNRVLTPKIAGNVKKVIENFEMNQIFGRKEIKNELQYGDYKAGKTIEAMQLLGIVVPVEGKGKGKYIFKNPK
jgi:ATP-dependent DNA helicase RecG